MDATSSDRTMPDGSIHFTKSRLPWGRDQLDHSDITLYMRFKKKDNPKNLNDVSIEYFVILIADYDPILGCCQTPLGCTPKVSFRSLMPFRLRPNDRGHHYPILALQQGRRDGV